MSISSIQWWENPRKIQIKLEPHQIKPMPLGHDTFIVVEIGGRQFDALIPSSSLVDDKYAPAALVGKNGDRTIVHFPVSNEGRPTWELTDAELESLIA